MPALNDTSMKAQANIRQSWVGRGRFTLPYAARSANMRSYRSSWRDRFYDDERGVCSVLEVQVIQVVVNSL